MKKMKKRRKAPKPKKRKRGVARTAAPQYNPPKNKVIDYRQWNKAGWNGISWITEDSYPYPVLGLNFEKISRAKMIFKEWEYYFGQEDKEDEIRISVIRGIDKSAPLRFAFHITQRGNAYDIDGYWRNPFNLNSKSITMQSDSAEEFNRFISNFQGEYGIAPTAIESDETIPLMNRVIRKQTFHVIDAWRIHHKHEDAWAIAEPENVLVPDDISDPPIQLLANLRQRYMAQFRANLNRSSRN